MKATKLTDGIYRLGVNLESDLLFEGMWPMPHGISINSYVVQGERTALIDLVEDIRDKPLEFEQELHSIPLQAKDIDYLIINHMEPDHTSWLPTFYKENPDLEFYITKKGAAMLKAFCGIEKNVHIVKTGDTIDLGAGKILTFYEAPNLHWPETMLTFEESSGILFTCDAFGSYGAITDTIFDDQLSSEQHDFFKQEALRYYANIIGGFSMFVEKAIAQLEDLDIKMIAPSHGIVWRENPQQIIDTYLRFAGYMSGPAEPEVTVIWSSMYGNTERLVNAMVQGVRSEGLPVHVHRVPNEHVGFILASAWKSAGLIIGMPTYEYRMFPPMAWILDMFGRKKVWNKKVLRFGSFGWSGGAQREMDLLTEKLKWDFLDPVEWQGAPDDDVLKQAESQSRELARQIKANTTS
ncbi:MAG: FprA family A-type flavoprotein [Thermodesulfobacteriota bacterium]|nr:FprA family A-type flavoprotein [Thermodesulfobacteriota bacterium]